MNITESSLSRIFSAYEKHQTGTISGFRYAENCGEGKVYTLSENKKRNSILKAKLLKLGYGVTPIKGTYIEGYETENAREVDEESFYVVDLKDGKKLKSVLIELGKEFDQDSIAFSEANGEYKLISTNTCGGYPGFGEIGVEANLGKPTYGGKEFKAGTEEDPDKVEKAEFFSKIRGRAFVFRESADNIIEFSKLSMTEAISVILTSKLNP